jgi:hypothetical protein
VGNYRVDLLLGDTKAVSVPFRVVGAAAPAIVAAMPARGVKDGEPVSPGEVFAPDAGTIYVWFRMAGHDAPTALRGVWHYLGGGGDRVIISSEIIMQANQDWGDFQLELPPGRPWPTGEYRVDIFIADKQAASVPFRVAEASAQPTPAAPKIVEAKPARGVKDGKPVDPRDVFTPDMNPIYVWYRIAGNAAPAEIRSIWHYLGGGEDVASEAEGGTQPAGREWGYVGKELPPGGTWPLGEYRVDIMIDGRVAMAVPFRVADVPAKPAAAPKVAIPEAPAGITVDGVEALLRELGARPERKTRKDGVPYFEFTIDGRRTVLALYGCAPGPCAQSLLHTGFKTDKKVGLQAINDWNASQRFVRAYLDADGDPVVESDLVVAGAPMATVREWIATWRQRVPGFVSMLAK